MVCRVGGRWGRWVPGWLTHLFTPRLCTICASLLAAASRVSSSYRPIKVLTSGGKSPSNTPPGPGSAA